MKKKASKKKDSLSMGGILVGKEVRSVGSFPTPHYYFIVRNSTKTMPFLVDMETFYNEASTIGAQVYVTYRRSLFDNVHVDEIEYL